MTPQVLDLVDADRLDRNGAVEDICRMFGRMPIASVQAFLTSWPLERHGVLACEIIAILLGPARDGAKLPSTDALYAMLSRVPEGRSTTTSTARTSDFRRLVSLQEALLRAFKAAYPTVTLDDRRVSKSLSAASQWYASLRQGAGHDPLAHESALARIKLASL